MFRLPVSDGLSRLIPRDASNPATLFLGKSFATQKFGTFIFIVFGSDGSKSSLPFAVPQCPAPVNAQQIQQLIDNIENDNQINEHAKSHLVSRLEKVLSALTDETSANDQIITCKFLNPSFSSLKALEKSNQITSIPKILILDMVT